MDISVIICTHNPRKDYLTEVLAALQQQTLAISKWELLLIDNLSEAPLAQHWDLSWHPNARHIREEALGLTPARICGIREATTELLVFVDDDNVLAANYLAEAISVSRNKPFLGVWSGQLSPKFEELPDPRFESFLPLLALRTVQRELWTNSTEIDVLLPYGAGLCLRSRVADRYINEVMHDQIRLSLDRKGGMLSSAGDADLVFTAIDEGFGMGLLPSLQLVHLIPAHRVKMFYLEQLAEEGAYSFQLLKRVRHQQVIEPTLKVRLTNFLRGWLSPHPRNRIERARWRGIRKALAVPL